MYEPQDPHGRVHSERPRIPNQPGRRALRALLVVALAAASGCSVASTAARSDRSPLYGSRPGLEADDRAAVDAPDPSATEEVSLEQLLAYAELHAPDLSVARARTELGDAAVAAASPLMIENPELGTTIGGRTAGSRTALELEVSLSQRFEIAGERRLRIEAAGLERELALAEEAATTRDLHVQIHTLFLSVLLARDARATSERVLELTEELLSIADELASAGETAPLTRLVAEAEVAQARQEVIAARQLEQESVLRLARAVGWPEGQRLSPIGALSAVGRARGAERLVAVAIEHNPLFRVRALARRAAQARVRSEDREAWPEPALGAAYAQENGEAQADNLWLVTLGLPLPLWDRNQGGRALARAELSIAESEDALLTETIPNELARAVNDLNAAAEQVTLYGENILPAVERNLQLIRRAYELGEVDIHQVSLLRERVLENRQRAVEARWAYIRALMELEVLLGVEAESVIEGRNP